MSKKILLPLIALTIPMQAVAAKEPKAQAPVKWQFGDSPFAECKDVTLISKKMFEKDKQFWNDAINECGMDIQVLPDTGFFQTVHGFLKNKDESTRSIAFLEKVGKRTAEYIELNRQISEQLQRCAAKDEKWFSEKLANARTAEEKEFYNYENCDDAIAKLKDAVKEKGPKARTALVAMQDFGNQGLMSKMGGGIKSLLRLNLPFEKQAPSAEETSAGKKLSYKDRENVESHVEEQIAENRKKWDAIMASNDKTKVSELPLWFRQYMEFSLNGKLDKYDTPAVMSALGEVYGEAEMAAASNRKDEVSKHFEELPVLAYLNNDNPSDADLAAALAQVVKNAENNKAEVEATMALQGNVGRGKAKLNDVQRFNKMAVLMKYGAVVKEILGEDKMECETATGIANHIANSELRMQAGLMVGMVGSMGAGAVLGPTVLGGTALAATLTPAAMAGASAAAVGLAAGAGFLTADYVNFAKAKRRAFGTAETMDRGKVVSNFADFEAARDQLSLGAALSPLDFLGTGTMLKAGALTAASAAGLKALTAGASRNALKQALKAKGMRDDVIENLFKQLQSNDPNVAAAAAKKLINETDLNPAQIKLLRTAASKGIIWEKNPESIKAVMDEVKKGNGQVWERAVKVLENVNSAKINAGNRELAIKAAMAGADFGANPQQLAAKINDWDQGLDGLAATYTKAKGYLNHPEVRGLASVQASQDAAFDRAVRESLKDDPEFNKLPKVEQEKIVSQLNACGTGKGM